VNSKVLQLTSRLAVARDEAFCFYYPDNLDLLAELGVELCYFSPMRDSSLPRNVDGIYLGGGYPELHGQQLAANTTLRRQIKDEAEKGLAIYAECGGLMYLTRAIQDPEGRAYEMVGLFPTEARMLKKRKALGYVEVCLTKDCLLGKKGMMLRGHEYHYSELSHDLQEEGSETMYELVSRKDQATRREGYSYRNVLASYVHIHFGSHPKAAQSFAGHLRKSMTRS
jgi:cobyrinic acid a,c-diamide synthase